MLKALVVEDEEDIKQLLLEELEDEGFQVVLADDGEMALQRLSHYIPDIIFVDVYMPVMDVLELIVRSGSVAIEKHHAIRRARCLKEQALVSE